MTYNLNIIQGHYPGEKLKGDRKSMQLIEVNVITCTALRLGTGGGGGGVLLSAPVPPLHFTSKLILTILAAVFFGVPVYFVC